MARTSEAAHKRALPLEEIGVLFDAPTIGRWSSIVYRDFLDRELFLFGPRRS